MIRISPGANVIRVMDDRILWGIRNRRHFFGAEITYGAFELNPRIGTIMTGAAAQYTTDQAFASLGRKRRGVSRIRRLTMEDHEIRSKSGVFEFFPNWDLEGKGTNLRLKAAQCLRGGVVAQPPSPLIPDQKQDLAEEADTTPPSVEVTTSALGYHASINRDSVGHSLGGYGCHAGGFQYISDACPFVRSTGGDNNLLVLSQHGGILRVPPDRSRDTRTSLPIFSSPGNACQIPFSTALAVRSPMAATQFPPQIRDSRNAAFIEQRSIAARADKKRSTRLDSGMPSSRRPSPLYDSTRVAPSLGLPGHNVHGMGRLAHRLTRHCCEVVLISEDSTTNLFNTSSVLKWFLRGEDRAYSSLLTRERARTSYPSSPTQCLLLSASCATLQSVSLGRLICGRRICSGRLTSRSFQVKAINVEFAVIGLAELYLANEGATVHGCSGSTVGEGDALVTLISERLRFEDIIFQGLPKIEQFLESRPETSVSTDLKDSFRDWSGMAWIFGRALGYLLGARTSLERSRVNLVDCIGRGYRSQGVQVAEKHVEMIVRQVTSKMVVLEDGMANAFLPGELIEVSRAWRMDCALEAKITCRPVLLGVTRASLNTKSFISGASFRETTRVLAGAAIRGQTDWLKGLKENVIVGRTVPAGTGCGGALRQVIPLDEVEEISGTGNSFHSEDLFSNTEFLLRLPLTIGLENNYSKEGSQHQSDAVG